MLLLLEAQRAVADFLDRRPLVVWCLGRDQEFVEG